MKYSTRFRYDNQLSFLANLNTFITTAEKLTISIISKIQSRFTYIGGGIIIKHKEQFYLFSAGHIFNLDSKGFGLSIGDNWIGLGASILFSSHINYSSYSSIDFSTILLNKKLSKKLEDQMLYLTTNDLITNHSIDKSSSYFCSGLPLTAIRRKSNFEFDANYQNFQVHPITNIRSIIIRLTLSFYYHSKNTT